MRHELAETINCLGTARGQVEDLDQQVGGMGGGMPARRGGGGRGQPGWVGGSGSVL